MNKNSKSIELTVKSSLALASQLLEKQQISSSQLDAELILATTLGVNRIDLHAHPEKLISKKDLQSYFRKIKRRRQRVPLAYILGYREFYGRPFLVNRHTLIPRPESENIIEILKTAKQDQNITTNTLLDIGTGSGCLGITAKLEIPTLDVYLSDTSRQALKIAKKNSRELKAEVKIIKSDLLEKISFNPTIILANLPYVNPNWKNLSPEIFYEPHTALFAKNNGLDVTLRLLSQIPRKTASECLVIIEADPRQHQPIVSFAKKQSLQLYKQSDYILAFIKNGVITKK